MLRTCLDNNLGRTVVIKTMHAHLAQSDYAPVSVFARGASDRPADAS